MNKKIIFCLLVSCLICITKVYAQPERFYDVKRKAKIIWQDHRLSFYCNCHFDKHLNVNFSSCDYQPIDLKRAKRIEWEHIVPVSWFGHQRLCWRQPICRSRKGKAYQGRNCCERVDAEFREMYHDLHNLVPAVGEINKARKHYRFVDGALKDNNRNGCAILIDDKARIVVPSDHTKGIIARAHLYMAQKYDIRLSHSQKKQYERWHKQYPPSKWEKTWNERIKEVQGTDNWFISGGANK